MVEHVANELANGYVRVSPRLVFQEQQELSDVFKALDVLANRVEELSVIVLKPQHREKKRNSLERYLGYIELDYLE